VWRGLMGKKPYPIRRGRQVAADTSDD
jgi:hypothetical protein